MEHARHTGDELAAKLREIYPEIVAHDLDLAVKFSHEKDAWLIQLKRGEHELATHLDRGDADGCLEGVECVHFGVQIGQFVANFGAEEN